MPPSGRTLRSKEAYVIKNGVATEGKGKGIQNSVRKETRIYMCRDYVPSPPGQGSRGRAPSYHQSSGAIPRNLSEAHFRPTSPWAHHRPSDFLGGEYCPPVDVRPHPVKRKEESRTAGGRIGLWPRQKNEERVLGTKAEKKIG